MAHPVVKREAFCPECNTVYPDRQAGEACPLCSDSSSRVLLVESTKTKTGRARTSPNLQNIPVRTDLGNSIRHCFVARGGRRTGAPKGY